jgi:Mn2+/Fe2+ NRAMP family transporter
MTTTQDKSLRSRIAAAWKVFLPGLFLLGFNIGTGSVTAMAKAGADYGMALLWALLLSCAVTWFMLDVFGRFAIATGDTALHAFRRHLHPAVGIFFIVALGVNVSGSVMGVMGIVADVSAVWLREVCGLSVPALALAILFSGLVFALFWVGRMDFFQKALAVMVAIMGAAFLINFIFLMPSVGETLAGIVPRMPEVAPGDGRDPFMVVASMVGTTVFSGLFILRTTLVKNAGWGLADLGRQRRDALLAAGMMFVLSAAVMGSAAGTLHPHGITLGNTSQLVTLLEPLAGSAAVSLLVVGLIAAGLSSQFPNVLLVPWLWFDYHGQTPDVKRPGIRAFVLGISTLGLVVPIFQARPVAVMVASQAFGALLLPVTVGCILWIGNRRDVMGEYRFRAGTNGILLLVLGFALVMMAAGLKGLVQALMG